MLQQTTHLIGMLRSDSKFDVTTNSKFDVTIKQQIFPGNFNLTLKNLYDFLGMLLFWGHYFSENVTINILSENNFYK